MQVDHNKRSHVYSRRNPSGCDKFYCLRRYRPVYYFWRWLTDWMV